MEQNDTDYIDTIDNDTQQNDTHYNDTIDNEMQQKMTLITMTLKIMIRSKMTHSLGDFELFTYFREHILQGKLLKSSFHFMS
jgi:hypothetical protein